MSSVAPPVRALELKQTKTSGVGTGPYWYLWPVILVPFGLKFLNDFFYMAYLLES